MKKILKKAAEGFLPGIGIGYIITIIVSYILGTGSYEPVVPSFEIWAGSPVAAVAIQGFFCGILGSVFAGAGEIWEYEKWSLFKRTLVFYITTIIAMIGISLLLHWIVITPSQIISFILLFTLIFFIIWIGIYLKIRKEVEAINQKLKK